MRIETNLFYNGFERGKKNIMKRLWCFDWQRNQMVIDLIQSICQIVVEDYLSEKNS